MSVKRFLYYIQYVPHSELIKSSPPQGVSSNRWSAMLKWYTERVKEGEL